MTLFSSGAGKRIRTGSIYMLVAVVMMLVGCGGGETMTASTEIPCDQVVWGFRLNKTDGSPWIGGSTLQPGGSMQLTVSGLWRPPDGRAVSGVCGDKVGSLTWESSDPTVARVSPVSARSAVATADTAGTADITARFLLGGVTPTSTYLRITVTP